MLTPRNAIIAVFVVAALSVVISVFNLMQPPDSNGIGLDSYGTRSDGYRALYETLEQLGVPVERSFVPPIGHLNRPVTLALVNPDPDLIEAEPEYMADIGQWIAEGGRVVLALHRSDENIDEDCDCETDEEPTTNILGDNSTTSTLVGDPATTTPGDDLTTSSFPLDLLGLESLTGVALVTWPLTKGAEFPIDKTPLETTGLDRWVRRTSATRGAIVPVQCEGELIPLGESLDALAVPSAHLQVIDPKAMGDPIGWLAVSNDKGSTGVLAAVYEMDQGRLILLSDSRVLENGLFGQASNAVFGAHLMAWGSRPIVMDDFYHGLTVRGNPIWLLTRFPYGLLALTLAIWTALLAWRAAIRLGPALAPRTVERRSVGEYVSAMACLFSGRKSRRHVLERLRVGGLWLLRLRLNLPPGRESLEAVSAALDRHDPDQGEALRRSTEALDQLINNPITVNPKKMCEVAKAFNQCMKKEKA